VKHHVFSREFSKGVIRTSESRSTPGGPVQTSGRWGPPELVVPLGLALCAVAHGFQRGQRRNEQGTAAEQRVKNNPNHTRPIRSNSLVSWGFDDSPQDDWQASAFWRRLSAVVPLVGMALVALGSSSAAGELRGVPAGES
jgi:hypothetical protein